LGSQTSGGIPTSTWNGDRYLEITVGGETLSPRELIRSVPIEDHQDIGDCLLLYYRTDDGEEWCYRFNGVYFGSGRTMRVYSIEEVDTGESEHSLLTWRLAKFHHGNEPVYWSNWNNRVSLTGSEELTMRRSPVTGGETGLPGIPGGKGRTIPGASPPGGDTGT